MLTIRFDELGLLPGERVLDLGCGTGRHSFEAIKQGAFTVAVDLDDGVLKQVRDMAVAVAEEVERHAPVAGGACTAGDALRLPFRDAAFDKVIVSEVLEHIPADSAALTEIARVVRPGGTVAVSVPRSWPERVCWALSDSYHSNDGGHVRIYGRSRLLDKIRGSGLRVTRSHHAHALHAPFWWLRCLVGVDTERHRLVQAYHRFLMWDMERRPAPIRALERVANPFMGKSLVVYARKDVSA